LVALVVVIERRKMEVSLMYVQPYEPRDVSFGPGAFGSYPTAATTPAESDSVADPWNDEPAQFGDAEGALEDGPLGQLGIGVMLQNLTGMMQQLAQMMQSLLGRVGGNAGNGPGSGHGLFGHVSPRPLPGDHCGCSQSPPPADVRYPLDAPVS
jgi:hypothetical protein